MPRDERGAVGVPAHPRLRVLRGIAVLIYVAVVRIGWRTVHRASAIRRRVARPQHRYERSVRCGGGWRRAELRGHPSAPCRSREWVD